MKNTGGGLSVGGDTVFLVRYILLSVRYIIGINRFTYKGFFKKNI